jgi:plastocyanin
VHPVASWPMRALSLVVMVLVAAVCVPGCSSGPESPPPCDNPTATTTVELEDFSFAPTCVQAQAGATLTLNDTGGAAHTFTVKGTGVDVQVDPGGTAQASLDGVAPGTYRVVCTFHPEMVAALRVT